MNDNPHAIEPEALLAHTGWLHAFARRLVVDDSRADDVVQETLLRAIESAPERPRALGAWLRTVAQNVAFTFHRRDAARLRREQGQGGGGGDDVPDPSTLAEKAELQGRLVFLVLDLEEPYRTTLLLHFFEGLEPTEIARRTATPAGTVRSRLKRGLDQLREQLDTVHDGDRRKWKLALIPLFAGKPVIRTATVAAGSTASVGLVGGLLAMSAKTKVVLAAVAAVLMIAGGMLWLDAFEGRADRPTDPDETPGAPPPLAVADQNPDRGADAEAPAGRGTWAGRGEIEGIVQRGARPVVATVELRPVQALAPGTEPWDDLFLLERVLETAPGGAPLLRKRTGPDGRFRFEEVGPGLYEVLAISPDGLRASANAPVEADGARLRVVVELPAGTETLRGIAVHRDGSPFVGRVAAMVGNEVMPELLGVPLLETDPDGRFRIGGLPAGPATVTLAQPGLRLFRGPIQVPQAGEVRIVVDEDLALLSGTVRSVADERPVPNAVVMIGGAKTPQAMRFARAETDLEGRFELQVPEGQRMVIVRAPGFVPLSRQLGAESELDLRLHRAAIVTGRVLDEAGRPLSGIPVWATDEGPRPQMGSGRIAVVSDEQGRYRIETSPGEVMIYALGRGVVSPDLGRASGGGFNPLMVEAKLGEEVTRDLTVVTAGRAEGRVLDHDGNPVPMVPVAARPSSELWTPAPFTAVSGEDGAFTFDSLVPGTSYRFEAEPAGLPGTTVGPLPAHADDALTVELRLPPAQWRIVRVTDEEGRPVTGAVVTLARRKGPASFDALSGAWTTGKDGTIRAGPAPAGALGVRARHPEFLEMADYVPVADGADGAVELTRGQAIAGQVVDESGQPVPTARVTIKGAWTAPVRAGPDGRFRLAGLEPKRYLVTAEDWATGKERSAVADVPAPTNGLRLTLEDASKATVESGLELRIVGPDGKLVRDADATLFGWYEGGRSRSSTDANGGILRYREPSAQATRFWVMIHHAVGADGTPLGALLHGPFSPPLRSTTISLGPSVSLSGRVVDSAGKGVSGVLVEARPRYADLPFRADRIRWHGDARTDGSGRFTIQGLHAGEYEAHLRTPPEFIAPGLFPVATETHAELRIVRGQKVSLRILDWKERPVAGARVQLLRRGPSPSSVLTDSAGIARLNGIDPGSEYQLRVQGPSNREDLMPRESDWEHGTEQARLERAFAVSGFVRDASGNPIEGASVYRNTGGESWTGVVSAKDGAFRFTQVPEGPVVLKATWEGRFPGAEEAVTVQAGSTGVALTLP